MRELLITVGEALYGKQWQSALAGDLGVTDRTMRRWVAGERIPDTVKADMLAIVRARGEKLERVAGLLI